MLPEYYAHIWDRLDHSKGRWMTGRGGRYYKCRCPAHDDDNPSMTLRVGENGKLIAKCHTGCRFIEIARSLGTEAKEWAPPVIRQVRKQPQMSNLGKIVAVYPYVNADGVVVYETVRYEPKDFRQRRDPRPGEASYGQDRKVWNLEGVDKILYNLPELIKPENTSRTVFVVEGEGKVEALSTLGILATCAPLGAGKWGLLSDRSVLAGRTVVVLPDYDQVDKKRGYRVGSKHAEQVANDLVGIAKWVRVVWLPGMKEGWDIKNWIASMTASNSKPDDLRKAIMAATVKTPTWVKGQECVPPIHGSCPHDFVVAASRARDAANFPATHPDPHNLLKMLLAVEWKFQELRGYLTEASSLPPGAFNSDPVVDLAAGVAGTLWRAMIAAGLVVSPKEKP